MTTRINGMAFDTFIGGTDIHVKASHWTSAMKAPLPKPVASLTANCAALSVPKVKSK